MTNPRTAPGHSQSDDQVSTDRGPPRRRPKVRPEKLARIRLAVYEAATYRCQDCGLHFPPPDGYTGRYALARAVPNRRPHGLGRYPTIGYTLQLDHVVPYSRGGRFELSNLQALCTGCNSRKGAGPQ